MIDSGTACGNARLFFSTLSKGYLGRYDLAPGRHTCTPGREGSVLADELISRALESLPAARRAARSWGPSAAAHCPRRTRRGRPRSSEGRVLAGGRRGRLGVVGRVLEAEGRAQS